MTSRKTDSKAKDVAQGVLHRAAINQVMTSYGIAPIVKRQCSNKWFIEGVRGKGGIEAESLIFV